MATDFTVFSRFSATIPEDPQPVRRRTVFKRARIFPITQLTGLTVHDASVHGFVGEAPVDLSLSQIIHVSEDGHRFDRGRICWIDGRRFGAIHMERDGFSDAGRMDPLALPRCRTVPGDGHAATGAHLALSHPMRGALVRNISDGGAMVETVHPLPVGLALLIEIGAGEAVLGHVRWCADRRAGIQFSRPHEVTTLVQ